MPRDLTAWPAGAISTPVSTVTKQTPTTFPLATPITTRKPSPGLAARLQALGLATQNNRKSPNAQLVNDNIGRIEQEKLDQLDELTRANLTQSVIRRRGRAWSHKNLSNSNRSSTDGSLLILDENNDAANDRLGPIDDALPSEEMNVPEYNLHSVCGNDRAESSLDSEQPETSSSDSEMIISDDVCLADAEESHSYISTPQTTTMVMAELSEPSPQSPTANETQATEVVESTESYAFNPETETSTVIEPALDETSNDNVISPEYHILNRPASIYTLSRASFASQLAQLTSLQLPDAESLATKIASLPSSQSATEALTNAAEQIKRWIIKALDVLDGLDADDDVEWAAAGGREGLSEVDAAINRFDKLVNVYLSAIEQLQSREDITCVSPSELTIVVTQVEEILNEWQKIKSTLKRGRRQVDIAMEWEEIWNMVFGDIGSELDALSKSIFEMEERRHKFMTQEAADVDIKELETVIEDSPSSKTRLSTMRSNRFSLDASYPLSPDSPQYPVISPEDSTLLGLFARMQPLRASLDFLPMRLSTFHQRAEDVFPTACEELESRRRGLDQGWQKLSRDAESLRRELGEDRWIMVFRGAGKQAQKMYESVDRSLQKVSQAIESGEHLNNPSSMVKKIENYETKKTHYIPAIDRVLVIIARGVQDRLTVNGEIVRLQIDMQRKWEEMKTRLSSVDARIESIYTDRRNKQLRDSISSLVSSDRSTLANHTPESSPASSVAHGVSFGRMNPRSRVGSALPQRMARSKSPGNSLTSIAQHREGALSSLGFSMQMSTSRERRGSLLTPIANRFAKSTTIDNKPRWSSNVKPKAEPLGFTLNELQLNSPSPFAKQPVPIRKPTQQSQLTSSVLTSSSSSTLNKGHRSVSTPVPSKGSKIPMPSPSSTSIVATNNTNEASPSQKRSLSRFGFHNKSNMPVPNVQNLPAISTPPPSNRTLKTQRSMSNMLNSSDTKHLLSTSIMAPRAISSLAFHDTNKRHVSMIPTPTKSLASTPTSIMSRGRPGISFEKHNEYESRIASPYNTTSGRRTPNERKTLDPAVLTNGRRTPSGRLAFGSRLRESSTGSSVSNTNSVMDRPRPWS